jgi:phosphatidate cytidylyltransferase
MGSLYEFYKMALAGGIIPLRFWGFFSGIMLYVTSWLFLDGILEMNWLTLNVLPLVILFISALYRSSTQPMANLAVTVTGILYCFVPFILLGAIAHTGGEFEWMIVLGMFVLIWIFDSFAYLTGIWLGRNRLFERISPKKSWEGFIGGAVITLLATWLLSPFMPVLDQIIWMGIAVITIIAGTYGDLVESMFKRSAGIKDSGNIMPGHGGVLDRFDAMLFISPIVWIYLHLILRGVNH